MTFLLAAISLFAVLSGLVAAGQVRAMMRVGGMKGLTWQDWLFGWWRFDTIAARAGLAGEEYVGTYKRSVIAFIVFLILGLLLSGWMASQQTTAPSTTANTNPINDWRVLPAGYAEHFALRRVAPMPGVTMLES